MNKDKLDRHYQELKKDAQIDKNNLDEECCRQTFLYVKWSKRLALAEANLRRVEHALTRYKAEMVIQGKEEGLGVAVSEATYRKSMKYIELGRKKSRILSSVKLAENGVHTLLQRRAMLDNLVKLHSTGYYHES